MEKMFTQSKEQKWKKLNSDHISSYNKDYYKTNKGKIHARRKVQRAEKAQRKKDNILGF